MLKKLHSIMIAILTFITAALVITGFSLADKVLSIIFWGMAGMSAVVLIYVLLGEMVLRSEK